MKKLKAFTLMELLIGMIISSIVISVCYMSYTIIHKQYLNYKSSKKEVVAAMQFNSILMNEIANADKVIFNENKQLLIQQENLNFEYNFEEKYILRKSTEVIDTFYLESTNIESKFLSNENVINNLVVSLSFDAMVLGEQEHFHYNKIYDAETIINDEIIKGD